MSTRRLRGRSRLLAAGLALALPLLAAPAANATSAGIQQVDADTYLLVIDGTDGDDAISVSKGNSAGTEWRISDSEDPDGLDPGDGCFDDFGSLQCDVVGVDGIDVITYEGDDTVAIYAGVVTNSVVGDLRGGDDFLVDQRAAGFGEYELGDGADRASIAGLNSGGLTIRGGDGPDSIRTAGSDDDIDGGPGTDLVNSGAGDDSLSLRDGERDEFNCGAGADSAQIDGVDAHAGGCEQLDGGATNPPPGGGGGTTRPTGGGTTTLPPTTTGGTAAGLTVVDATYFLQRIRKVRRGGLIAGVRTNAAGTWKVGVFIGRKRVGGATKHVASGYRTVKLKLTRAARRRLARVRRTLTVTVRHSFTDAQGRRASDKADIVLLAKGKKPPSPGGGGGGGAVKTGVYDCYSFDRALGNSRYWGSVQLASGGRYSQSSARRGMSLVSPKSGSYSASGSRITFSSGPWSSLYGVPNTATRFDVWVKGEQVKSYTCYFKF